MNNSGRIKGSIKFDNGETIDMGLDIISFEEDGTQFIYCPALDLSGYGKTVADARASLKITIEEYFDYTAKKKTRREDLPRMGWHERVGGVAI